LKGLVVDYLEFTHLSRKEIEAMLGLSELKNTRFYQEAVEEGRQEAVEEGRQEAVEEGRQEGRQEIQKELVAAVLSNRFSDLDQGLLKVVESLADKPPSEFMASLLADSREVLVEKFGRHPS
jgi:predicted transposase YdaD